MRVWVEGDAFVLLRCDLVLTYDGGHFELCQVELGPLGFHGCQLHRAVLENLIVYQLAQKTVVFEEPKSTPVQNTGAS
jgi:hypothetical protein